MTIDQAENLISDSGFQQLKYLQEKTNVFTVVGQTHTEHWHSAFMRWLFEPQGSLGLGHFPLVRLLTLYMVKNEDCDLTLRDVYSMDLDEVRFVTEKTFTPVGEGKKRSIDVYGESDELIVVIENKVTARENMNGTTVGQTKDYRDYAESIKGDRKTVYLFITPDPRQKPYDDHYTQITYQELYDYVIAKCIAHPQVRSDGKYLLEQYANNLKESVDGSPMALVNTRLCRSIYENNIEALDEIYEKIRNRSYSDDDLAYVVYNRYHNVFDEIYLSIDEYGSTPSSNQKNRQFTFDDLYRAGLIKDGTEFTMSYDGVTYYAVAEYRPEKDRCDLLVLDDNKAPYIIDGKKRGYYSSPSSAAVDAVKMYRKIHNSEKDSSGLSLNGTAYWKIADGETFSELTKRI